MIVFWGFSPCSGYIFLLNIKTFGNYIAKKPKTRPSSDMVNSTTQLLIRPEAQHKEYKKEKWILPMKTTMRKITCQDNTIKINTTCQDNTVKINRQTDRQI